MAGATGPCQCVPCQRPYGMLWHANLLPPPGLRMGHGRGGSKWPGSSQNRPCGYPARRRRHPNRRRSRRASRRGQTRRRPVRRRGGFVRRGCRCPIRRHRCPTQWGRHQAGCCSDPAGRGSPTWRGSCRYRRNLAAVLPGRPSQLANPVVLQGCSATLRSSGSCF